VRLVGNDADGECEKREQGGTSRSPSLEPLVQETGEAADREGEDRDEGERVIGMAGDVGGR
jgi:hypothetical protein